MPIEYLYSRSPEEKPRADLLKYVIGSPEYELFIRTGAEIFTMFDLACQRFSGKSLAEFNSVLDFGCGVGRILQFFKDKSTLSACDVLAPAISYLNTAIPEVDAYNNSLMPPLRYCNDQFDLIYSFSVFSHLRLDVENVWLSELKRVGRSGCLYLITVHGDWCIDEILKANAPAAKSAGFTYRQVHTRTGGELDFPDYYEASFHTADWIRANWSEWFDVVEVIRGDKPSNHLPEGASFEPDGLVSKFGPMGQDLIVMRKR